MCTLEKRGDLFFLTLTGVGPSDEHRLSPAVIESILSALSDAAAQFTPGCALITTSQGKFFSNGFDLGWAQSAGSVREAEDRLHGMVHSFCPVVAAFLSLPMPTIAAVQGHAAAAGMMLALCHDYMLLRSDRGVLYMPEVDIGLTLPDYFSALGRAKIGSVSALQELFLHGAKVGGEEAVKLGVAWSAHKGEEALMEASINLGEKLAKRKRDGEVFAEIRKSLYPELCAVLGLTHKAIATPKL
ncbi:hypothetical protein SAY87_030623 [Trapa incisa]|uniref:Delta(3)-Delta(2)-enoyl-CoA isomerase n=1 Tax=Trapa incisa TaxID=236973 RepID=A0AAN7KVJ5_9MYRT|nr:hypothetical protein SAY87_030623 [Trapa incisa]